MEFRGKKKEKGIKFDQKQALKAVLFVRKRVTLFYLDVYFDFWKRVSLAERQAENASKYKPIVQHSLQIDKLMIAANFTVGTSRLLGASDFVGVVYTAKSAPGSSYALVLSIVIFILSFILKKMDNPKQ